MTRHCGARGQDYGAPSLLPRPHNIAAMSQPIDKSLAMLAGGEGRGEGA